MQQEDGTADRLVEDRRGDAAVQPAGVALVLLGRGEDAEQLSAGGRLLLPPLVGGAVQRVRIRPKFVEAAVQPEGVLTAAHQAHPAHVLGAQDRPAGR